MAMNNARQAMTAAALNPRHSVVVEACAGSGKTWLLVSRILRLLLTGAAPSSILAITFTRKAAQEMQERLMDWLAFLATADEADARIFLQQRAMSDGEILHALPRVKTLFTEVAFASPKLAISTFHGWFQQLLSAAPMGESMHDATIAESESSLLDEAWLNLGESLNRAPESETAQALSRLFAEWGLSSTKTLLWNFIKRRAEWRVYEHSLVIDSAADDSQSGGREAPVIDVALARWRQEWDVDLSRNLVDDWAGNEFNDAAIRAVIRAITSTPKMTEAALKWPPALESALAIADPAQKFKAIRKEFLTLKDEPRANQSRWAEQAGGGDYFQRVYDSILQVVDAQTNQKIFAYNRDALIAGTALLDAYETLKAAQRTIDFADLEWRAFSLLSSSEHADTIQYRLDQRYRHILLDEFQDTNPIQWQCLTAWLDASVAADNKPTVFMVGDPKQAIYRFRRTDSRLFQIAKQYFQTEFDAQAFELNLTRRNAPAVVKFVNAVFEAEPIFKGYQKHVSERENSLGEVVALPAIEAEMSAVFASDTVLRNPLVEPRPDTSEDRFANEAHALADAISQIVGRVMVDEDIDGKAMRRLAEYRDVKVLFRRRAPLAAFEHALRAARIPYVGAKPGGLMSTLEARDMVALLTFLSAPDDDLALAQVLKSPLFGVDDQVLLRLRFDEVEGTWWQRVVRRAADETSDPIFNVIAATIRAWLHAMDHLPVHDLLDRVYHEADVLTAYSQAVPTAMRAGVVANLNAFMALALAVDSGRYPSLTRFLNELKRYRTLPDQDAPDEGAVIDDDIESGDEIEAESNLNAVGLMTIHAAKGLEAPIVFLIDADTVSTKTDSHTVLCDWQPDEKAPRHFSFWATNALKGNRRNAILEAEANYQSREQLNLLYVAATRAKQFFIISGTAGKVSAKANETMSWLGRAVNAGASASLDFSLNSATLGSEITFDAKLSKPTLLSAQSAFEIRQAVPPVARNAIGKRAPPACDDGLRVLGIEVHALLEMKIPASNKFIRTNTAISPEAVAIAEKIVQSAALQKFFNPDQYVAAFNELEMSVMVQANSQTLRIDRLVEFADEVWVLDYKTGGAIDDAAIAQHRAQLEAYCEAITPLYPAKTMRGAFINSEGALTVIR